MRRPTPYQLRVLCIVMYYIRVACMQIKCNIFFLGVFGVETFFGRNYFCGRLGFFGIHNIDGSRRKIERERRAEAQQREKRRAEKPIGFIWKEFSRVDREGRVCF